MYKIHLVHAGVKVVLVNIFRKDNASKKETLTLKKFKRARVNYFSTIMILFKPGVGLDTVNHSVKISERIQING